MKIHRNPVAISIVCLFMLCLTSCDREMFFQYTALPEEGWQKDELVAFEAPVSDTISHYNIYVHIRNAGDYPYQNFWFFTKEISPDGRVSCDTIECYLADQRGKWLGSGAGALFEMTVLCRQQLRFNRAGVYRYEIKQGMREELLRGIRDIGLRIEKSDINGEK